jgi:hypothetical protein
MGISQVFPFTDSINYALSNGAIAAGKGKLAIVPNPAQLFQQDFSADTGFTYDSAKAEFTGGLVRQKDQRPVNSVVAATYNSSKNLNWSQGGSLIGTDVGSPVLNAGTLECLGGGNKGMLYQNAEIANVGNIGTFKLKFTPNYSGTPAANLNIFELSPPSGNNSRMLLMHASTGTFRLTAYTSVGTAKYSAQIMGAAWSPVAGQTYEIELVWDTQSAGVVRLFIDGVSWGATAVSSYARGTDASQLRVGAGSVYPNADGSFEDVVLFSNAQHTAGYTPGYALPEYSYAASTIVLPAFSYTGLGTIQAVESSTVTEAGAPRYLIAGLYWNGSAWTISNGTYAQASSSADIIANLPSLNVTGATSVPVSVLFPDTNTQNNVDLISVTVTGQKYSANGYIEPAQAIQVKSLLSYTQSVTLPTDTSLKIALKIDGVLKWFNGTAWVASNGTAAEANLASELDAAFALLELGVNSSIFLRWILTTSVNTSTPEIDEAIISYDFGALQSTPEKCVVFGYVRDIQGLPQANVKVSVQLNRGAKEYKEAAGNMILSPVISVNTDANGYFSMSLIRSSEYEGTAVYQLTLAKSSLEASLIGSAALTFEVPDAETKDISDLLAAA